MIKKILKKLGYVPTPASLPQIKPEKPRQIYSTENWNDSISDKINNLMDYNFKNAIHPNAQIAMDSGKGQASFATDNNLNIKNPNFGVVPEAQILWYAGQSFIGSQLCAMLAQQWLVSKACLMPAKDATRNGYEITVNDGSEVDSEILDEIRKLDVDYKINKNLIEFVQMGRVFGIRIAMFLVTSDDPDYYRKPFNIDGVAAGSYRGISQVDPYWITPQLDTEASGNPAAIDFYEPTWWIINGHPIHRTHLVIFRTEEVSDILKPTYIFGGVPIPQKIAERVFAAEKCANEAPQLLLTKRTDVIKADLPEAAAKPCGLFARINAWVFNRDNYGVKMLGLDEEMQQFDTSLTDLDSVIMTQYQLVAAASNVPATKLLGTQPKGFNSTGEFEESSYHEELESVQKHDLTPFLDRHHLLLIKSEIAPKYKIKDFNVTVAWNRLDAMTAKEEAEINRFEAETGKLLIEVGAIDGMEERQRIMTDPKSGYTGLKEISDDDDLGELSDIEGA